MRSGIKYVTVEIYVMDAGIPRAFLFIFLNRNGGHKAAIHRFLIFMSFP